MTGLVAAAAVAGGVLGMRSQTRFWIGFVLLITGLVIAILYATGNIA